MGDARQTRSATQQHARTVVNAIAVCNNERVGGWGYRAGVRVEREGEGEDQV